MKIFSVYSYRQVFIFATRCHTQKKRSEIVAFQSMLLDGLVMIADFTGGAVTVFVSLACPYGPHCSA
jgi:hypothetical protein